MLTLPSESPHSLRRPGLAGHLQNITVVMTSCERDPMSNKWQVCWRLHKSDSPNKHNGSNSMRTQGPAASVSFSKVPDLGHARISQPKKRTNYCTSRFLKRRSQHNSGWVSLGSLGSTVRNTAGIHFTRDTKVLNRGQTGKVSAKKGSGCRASDLKLEPHGPADTVALEA